LIKRWKILPKKSDDLIEQLLINRKIKKEDWPSFLNPDFEKNLFNPFLMKGMKEAVKRILQAISGREIIGLFGDYDADGIPGTALLFNLFKYLGIKTFVYIPSRKQGYGLNNEGIEYFLLNKVNLIITVDLGVRNIKEIEYAQKLRMEVIVFDHHEVSKKLPRCIIVDPKQGGDKYPFRELAATGVVFKLLQALSKHIPKISQNYLKWSLDLVAISTICDIVPLISENRIFTKFGLIVLKKTKHIGLKTLYQKAMITPEKINTYAVGFQIGPRINAPGRMDHANESFFLLTTTDSKEADKLADILDKINRQRQAELERVLNEARKKVCEANLQKKKVIIISEKNWPQGIVGLVAGRLMEEFARPVIVCEKQGSNLRGSARSIEAFDLIAALDEAKIYLSKYGGHKKAAGLTLENKHLSGLYDKLLEVADSKLKDEDLTFSINIDAKLKIKEINTALINKIKKFEPFGLGNPRPVFILDKIKISNIRIIGKKSNHLKFKVGNFEALGFDMGYLANNLVENGDYNIVFTLDEDEWNGQKKIQLKIIDIKNTPKA